MGSVVVERKYDITQEGANHSPEWFHDTRSRAKEMAVCEE